MLFNNQPDFSTEELEGYAQNTELDLEKFKQDYYSSQVADLVKEDADLASRLKLNGTPTFYFVYDDKVETLNLKEFT